MNTYLIPSDRFIISDVLDVLKVIVNGNCQLHGTCKDCLEDGRGTHTEQLEFLINELSKKYS